MLPVERKNKSNILIFCVGNYYRSDDGVGELIGRKLKTKNLSGVHVIETETAGVFLPDWTNHDKVILIDAVSSHSPAGTIFRFDLKNQKIPFQNFQFSSHNLSMAQTIALAIQLNGLPAELRLFAIEGKTFSKGTALTTVVAKAAEVVSKEVTDLCFNWLEA